MKIQPFKKDPDREYIEKLSNHLFDYVMPSVSPTAWMVLCLIIRKTTGWRKESDNLSLGEIKKGTGIKSDTTIIKAVNELEEKGYIIANRHSQTRKANTYALNVSLEIELPTTPKNEVVTTTESIVEDEPTSESEVVTTPKNEVDKPLTTPKNGDTKEDSFNPIESNRLPNTSPYGEGDKPKKGRKQTAPDSPAFKVFTEITEYYAITTHWRNEATRIVGEKPEDLEFWRKVVIGWTGKYPSKHNIEGMLDFYKRREIPGYQPGGAIKNGTHQEHHPRQKSSAAFDAERVAELERQASHDTS